MMNLHGHSARRGSNVRSLLAAGAGGGARIAYHAMHGAGRDGRGAARRPETLVPPRRGVPVYLPRIPDMPGVDVAIEITDVPRGAILSAGRALASGAWLLRRDDPSGLRLLPPVGGRLAHPVSLHVTVSATDIESGRVAKVSATVEVGAPWDDGPSGPACALRYSLVDDAGGRFEIDPVTGLVSVADETLLDPVGAPRHTIAVRTVAAHGGAAIRRFRITLLEGPGAFSISELPGEAVAEMPAECAA